MRAAGIGMVDALTDSGGLAKGDEVIDADIAVHQSVLACERVVGQSQHGLNVIEFVHVLALVQQDFTVGVVDDAFLYNRRLDDVIYFL